MYKRSSRIPNKNNEFSCLIAPKSRLFLHFIFQNNTKGGEDGVLKDLFKN